MLQADSPPRTQQNFCRNSYKTLPRKKKKKVKILKYENIPLNNLPMVLKQKEFVFKKKMFFSN